MTGEPQPWGRLATFGLALLALIGSQTVALLALTWWYGVGLTHLPDFSGDGVAISLIIFISIPVELVLLFLLAQRGGASAIDYLGYKLPHKSELLIGLGFTVALIVIGNIVSWFAGRVIVTPFQLDIYSSASAAGAWPLLLLWLAIVVVTPIGEETLFRGFLFRGWLRAPRDAWPAILLTSLLWALIHVQYDWFVIAQVFVFGVMLGWLRWASGSTLLTMILHGLINCEGMLETVIGLHHGVL
jgi:membrane protease YdiL (CAAX protease family)